MEKSKLFYNISEESDFNDALFSFNYEKVF